MPATVKDFLLIGRIRSPHGLTGAVHVFALTDDPDRFFDLKTCLLINPQMKIDRTVTIDSVRIQPPNRVIIQLALTRTRTEAEALHGFYLGVYREQAVQLPPDRWFVCDLIGCAVHDDRFGYLGTVADLVQGPAQDVYIIQKEGSADLLFPALKSILLTVDIAKKRIDVHLPDGLFEIYR